MRGLSFLHTHEHKIWLSLKIIRVPPPPHPASFPLWNCRSWIGDSSLVNCSCGRRLLPHKLEILKYQSHLFTFMLKWRIRCPNLPASVPTKCYMSCGAMYLPFRTNPVFLSSVGTIVNGSIFSHSAKRITCGNLCLLFAFVRSSPRSASHINMHAVTGKHTSTT